MEPLVTFTKLAEGGAIGAGLGVMKGTAANQAKLPTGAGVVLWGVTGHAVDAAGKPITIVAGGIVKCVAKSAIAVGDPIQAAGVDGKFQAAAPGAGVNAEIAGFALEAAAAENDTFDALICQGRIQG